MDVAWVITRRVTLAFGFMVTLLAASPAQADSLTLLWDPNVEPVAGYIVYTGSQRFDVGNTTSFTMTNVVPGQEYCFSVSAYTETVEGPRSPEVCGFSNQFPTLSNPGNQTAVVGQTDTLQLSGADPDGEPLTYSATGLPPGLALSWNTGFISGTPTAAGSYAVTVSVSDGVLTSASQTFTWSVTSTPETDTSAPTVTITSPTSASAYTSLSSNVALAGTAGDNVGVTAVSWSNDRGGSGTAVGTVNWNIPSIGLQVGTNVITVRARDAAGNQSSDVLTVSYSAPDTTSPTITINSPTTSSAYSTSASPLSIAGTAADNVGVTQVTWTNSRGGSGTASGTTNWSASGITLQGGTNIITVTARDAASNVSTDVLTVTYSTPDGSSPSVSILGPTSNASYTTTSSVVTLGGTASDDRGVTAVTWANDRGGAGFASGTTTWSVASVALQTGTNVITVTAQDAAGNRGTDVLTVNYTTSDTTRPLVTITVPTSSSSFTTSSSSIRLAGTASDSGGVVGVSWFNDRGGSGVASGTTSWSIASVPLQPGTNRIAVRARDAAGNQSTDVLTVSYTTTTSTFVLGGTLYRSGSWLRALLQWTSVQGQYIDVYLNGARITRTANDGSYVHTPRGSGPFTYRVCVTGTTLCSNTITLSN